MMGDGLMANRANNRWKVVGVSAQGVSHLKTATPCQDAHCWEVLPNGVLIAAVSDGAGSAAFSEEGANVAADAAIAALRRILTTDDPAAISPEQGGWHGVLSDAMEQARQSVVALAERRGEPLREFAATLIVLIATSEFVTAMQVGDGAAVAGDDAGALFTLTSPQSGEYINETFFLASPEALDSAQFAFRRGRISQLALLSDGLQLLALKMPAGEPHAPFFAPLFRFAAECGEDGQQQLQSFLRSPRIADRSDDDLTLLLAVNSFQG